MKGKKHTEQSKKRISESLKGRKRSEEHNRKIKEAMLKHNASLPKTLQCPHCGKVGARIAMYRWHMDKCKYKRSDSE